ncbi:MAG: dienelactone hydrolase family protein [Bacteroidaceae bacterium]|nr:dienelactone hydrolase family protein [Bacteroidaceae bacterium]
MKRLLFLLMCGSVLFHLHASAPSQGYETRCDMPLYYETLCSELSYPDAWGNSEITSYDEWREHARGVLLNCLQYTPDSTPFDWQIVNEEQRDGYKALRIMFNINHYVRVPAYLLLPDGDAPFPAVVVLHDHGAKFDIGKEKNVRPLAGDTVVRQSSDAWVRKCYDGIYTGDFLARNGYVVLAVDALFWGERGRVEGVRYDSQQALASNLLQMGRSWCGMITTDDMRCADFLATLPFVDAERIGAVGFSMGAHRAWMLSAATDVVKCAACVCWMCTTNELMTLTNNQNKGGSAYSMIVPGLRNHLDYPHVAAIACPKPMFFINGRNDKLFPIEGVEEAYAHMHNVWDECGVDDRLITTIYDTPHVFNRDMHLQVLQFLNTWLRVTP